MKISFIVPIKNEQDSLEQLVASITRVMEKTSAQSHEIVMIDDGSDDDSWNVIEKLASKFSTVKGIRLRRNFGKAVALDVGFKKATGDIVFTMDGDLQDDPKEIPRFLVEIESGYDLVSGWKRNRFDPISKTAPSKVFNKVTSLLTGIKLNDFNCGYKCYRREVIDQLNLYGEMHRYVPVLADNLGFKIGEIEVEHQPRRHGTSKYGWERYVRGLVDLLTVLATTKWMQKPGHLFGGLGLLLGGLGFAVLAYLSVLWFTGDRPIGDRPLMFLGVMLSIFGLQMVSLGVIAEFFIKTSSGREYKNYVKCESGSTST